MLHVYFTSVQRKEEPPNGTQVSQENMDTHESLDDLCRSHLVNLESTANGSVFHTSMPLDLFQILLDICLRILVPFKSIFQESKCTRVKLVLYSLFLHWITVLYMVILSAIVVFHNFGLYDQVSVTKHLKELVMISKFPCTNMLLYWC
jgi:hypothetical protein